MTKKRTKTIKGKRYKRYNGYATRTKAEKVSIRLKGNGVKQKDGRVLHYDNARIIHDETLNTRPYVLWVHGKYYSYPKGYKHSKYLKGK